MPTVGDLCAILESIAPARWALDWDRVGLQVGDPNHALTAGLVCMDVTTPALAEAVAKRCQVVISHHPLVFRPLDKVVATDRVGSLIALALKSDLSLVAAHTNWDAAPGGINEALAASLGLSDVSSFGVAAAAAEVLVVTYVPGTHADTVIDSASAAGAGRIGAYERCAFLSEGAGTYRPMEDAQPMIGTIGEIERTPEVRIEMVCPLALQGGVIAAIRRAHPYDEPVIEAITKTTARQQPVGRVGSLPGALPLASFAAQVQDRLGGPVSFWGDASGIRRVAIVGGSASEEWKSAQKAGADVLVTGEVKHHHAVEASEAGFALVQAGHYETEQPGMVALAERLAGLLPEVAWLVHEPMKGFGGRA